MTDKSEQSELNEIIRQTLKGNEQAFRLIFERHVEALFRFLHQFSKSSEELDDWVQRTFIRAYERLNQFDSNARFEPWLFQIGINEMRTDRRRAKIVQFIPAGDQPNLEPVFEEQFEWSITMKDIIRALDENKRMVFTLHEVEGFTHKEIASMLQITESHSRSILMRTKQELRTHWNDERKVQ